jgi:CheY-like chemotaxis protein
LAAVLVAGLDSRGLLLEAPLLQREGCAVEQRSSAREVLRELGAGDTRLVVLGSLIEDYTLPDTVRRIRASSALRAVSILALIPTSEPHTLDREVAEAGANATLRRPLDRAQLESWLAKLLTVARRVEVRIPVDGQVVGSARRAPTGHFYGVARNLSVHGLLLASPLRLTFGLDLELDLRLADTHAPLKLLGRVVREAADVRWPYLGYGIEFLWTDGGIQAAIEKIVNASATHLGGSRVGGIHSTLTRGAWVYEILQPSPAPDGWQVEIRRAPRENWRPGGAGPFFVVAGASPTEALLRAREFLGRNA